MICKDVIRNDVSDLEKNIKSVLFTKEQIDARVFELADEISRDYKNKQLVLVGVLNGATVFLCDLMRKLLIGCEIDFISASSYGNSAYSSGKVSLEVNMKTNPKGKDVIIVEDILDRGYTLSAIKDKFKELNANSVKLAVLIEKTCDRKTEIKPDYCGFRAPDEFIVGYGLDFAERYRNLPYIGVLKPEVYS